MKKITLLFSALLLTAFSWQANAQILNQAAAWPNATWTLGGTYTASALLSDPTTSTNFSYDDDASGSGSTDILEATSPVIDLTAAAGGGETWVNVDYDYDYNLGGSFDLEWYDADALTWVIWEAIPDNSGSTSGWCASIAAPIVTSATLDISVFTATQLSGFQYRFHYDASSTWGWGMCTSSPTIVSSSPPSCLDPSALAATNITYTSADLGWTENGTATVWDIEYGMAPYAPTGTPTVSGVTNPYNYSGLAANTTYEFYVRADCGGTNGTSAWAGPYSFFTGYCSPNPSSVDNDGIINVTIGSINNTTLTELGNYGDYTAQITDVQQSVSVDLSVTVTYNNYNVFAWVDWNNDLDFDDAGETYYVGEFATTGVISIPVPAAASLGNHRLRIGGADSGLGSTIPSDPCYAGSWGAFEDYTLNVTPPPACVPPSALTATNITSSSADLGWTENGTATVWDIEYGMAPYAPTGTPTVSGVTNPYNYSGLAANTTYEFYVRADCGGTNGTSTWTGPYSFTTLCSAFTLPWSENFDAGTTAPSCWSQGSANAEDWLFAATGGHVGGAGIIGGATTSGNNFAWIDDSSPDNTGTTLESPLVDISSLTVPMLSFYLISNNEGNSGTNVNFSVDVWDGAAWNVGVYTSNSNTLNGEWQQISVALSSLTITGPVQLKFIVDEDPTGNFYDDVAIDDVTFVETPACLAPTMLSATNITTSSADLGWTENGTATSWEVEYDSTGFVQGTGNTVVTGTNPHALNGLTANYSYDFYVRAICGVGDSSAWAGPYSFITSCNTAAITYTQDFTTWPITCWDLTGGSQSWSDNGSGIALANFWSWNNPNDAIMSTEPIDISVDARVRFDWSHLYSATYPLDSLSVDVKVLPGGTWTSIWGKGGSDLESNDGAGNTTPGSMITETILLDPATYTGQDVQVRFVATSGWGPDLFVDNLIIEPVPACIDPSGLTASNITTTSADLAWTENGTATSWEVEYDSTGFVQGTGNTVVTGTNPHALNGLTANYSYDFYVRAICGVGDSSAWAGPYSFITPCNTAAITYTQDFTTWPITCWDLTGGSQSWSDNGSGIALANFWSWSSPNDAIMSTEPIDISVDARVRFDWSHLYSATYPLDSLSVDVKVLPGGTWTSIWGKGGSDLESNDGAGNTTPGNMITETILLDPATYTGQDVQVRFVATSGWGPDLFVDNLIIDALPTCAVDLGADTALCSGQDSLMLDAGAGPYTYEWSNMASTQTIVVTGSAVGIVDYSVVILDSITMCTATDSVSITFGDCSSISELSESTVSVYPNPSNGNFIISLSNISEQVSVQVNDMQGRLIYSQTEGLKVGKENAISLDNVERGVYLISVSSSKGRYTQSIVIE